MRKIFFVLFVVFTITNAAAQSPIIKQFRAVIKDAPNHFATYQKDLLSENPEKHSKTYSSTIEDNAISSNFIIKTEGKTIIYTSKFDVNKLEGMMLKMFFIISGQYIAELNEMVKSGAYTGTDYKDGDDSVTELKDLNGNTAVKYISNLQQHFVMIYSPKVQ